MGIGQPGLEEIDALRLGEGQFADRFQGFAGGPQPFVKGRRPGPVPLQGRGFGPADLLEVPLGPGRLHGLLQVGRIRRLAQFRQVVPQPFDARFQLGRLLPSALGLCQQPFQGPAQFPDPNGFGPVQPHVPGLFQGQLPTEALEQGPGIGLAALFEGDQPPPVFFGLPDASQLLVEGFDGFGGRQQTLVHRQPLQCPPDPGQGLFGAFPVVLRHAEGRLGLAPPVREVRRQAGGVGAVGESGLQLPAAAHGREGLSDPFQAAPLPHLLRQGHRQPLLFRQGLFQGRVVFGPLAGRELGLAHGLADRFQFRQGRVEGRLLGRGPEQGVGFGAQIVLDRPQIGDAGAAGKEDLPHLAPAPDDLVAPLDQPGVIDAEHLEKPRLGHAAGEFREQGLFQWVGLVRGPEGVGFALEPDKGESPAAGCLQLRADAQAVVGMDEIVGGDVGDAEKQSAKGPEG